MDRLARVLFMSDQELTASSVPGGRGEPAAIRQARPSRPCCPTCWKAARPTSLARSGLAAGIDWVMERGPDNLRNHEVKLLQQVVDWAERTDAWQVAGRWDPAAHVGHSFTGRARGTHATGPGLDSRCQLRDRRPTGTALRTLYSSRTAHVSRGNTPAQSRSIHHAPADRPLCRGPHRDHCRRTVIDPRNWLDTDSRLDPRTYHLLTRLAIASLCHLTKSPGSTWS